MWEILASPGRSLAAGAAVTLVILALWLLTAGADRIGLLSFLLRWLHVFAGIVWVGMVWFVNFIQLVALQEADDAGRAALLAFGGATLKDFAFALLVGIASGAYSSIFIAAPLLGYLGLKQEVPGPGPKKSPAEGRA